MYLIFLLQHLQNIFECLPANPLSNTCDTPLLAYEAQKTCSILNSTSDVFSACVNVINSDIYYLTCIWDYCSVAASGDSDLIDQVKCNSFEAMSKECVENFLVIPWRNEERCRKLFLGNYYNIILLIFKLDLIWTYFF